MFSGKIDMTAVCKKAAVFLMFMLLMIIAGCTRIERDGMSPIPQNSPGGWELNPYGEFYN